jgi:S-methylmethionine-dependent homocysteine/selenocysteine methylase
MESGSSSFEEILQRVLDRLLADIKAMVAIMHCDLDVSDAALEIAGQHWQGPLGVYPNSGLYEKPHWRFDTVCTPAEFVSHAQTWIDSGAHIVGGCCGIGPQPIQALNEHIADSST